METKISISPGIGFGEILKYERGKALNYGNKKVIIATNEDLIASDTMEFDWTRIAGILVTKGTKNSHSAIVAKQHGVPAAIISDISELQDGDFIALDTNTTKNGELYYHPSENELKDLLKKLEILKIEKENLSQYKSPSTVTKDGHKVTVAANIGSSEEVPGVQQNGAEAVGVVRTELSYEWFDAQEGRLPTEDELYSEYKEISEKLKGKEIIIRTLDAGADKPVKSLIKAGVLKEDEVNPALGSRGIRPCLDNPDLFKTQIKAILRANFPNENLQIMFPMITSIEELKKGKEIVNESIEELKEQGAKFAETKIGIMVETPAIAQITDRLSNYCDFISVGTNDLTQYTTAADRMNYTVENIANPYNPGMLKMLNNIISGAHKGKKRIPVCVCGEIAGDLEYIPILLGMEVDEFSMNSLNIPLARRLISNLTLEECKELLNKILEKDTVSEIEPIVKTFYKTHNLQILAQEKQDRQIELNKVSEKAVEAECLKERYNQLVGEKLPKYLEKDR